jgi:hypothetical protein
MDWQHGHKESWMDNQQKIRDLIDAVRYAKRCQNAYEIASEELQSAQESIAELIGGDCLSSIQNGERTIGRLLTLVQLEE